MVTDGEVLALINSTLYQELAYKLAERSKIKILEFGEDLLKLDSRNVRISGLTCPDLLNLLHKRTAAVEKFVARKNEELLFRPGDEEYPIGMGLGDEGEECDSVSEGISLGFLLIGLTEFGLIERSKDDLLSYLKLKRIPHANQYANKLLKWHAVATNWPD